MNNDWLIPDWSVPANVKAVCTTRSGGVSQGKYSTMNLGDHVDDNSAAVSLNRERLRNTLNLSVEPMWLAQSHGCQVIAADDYLPGSAADASYTDNAESACVVLSADCLPILLCAHDGSKVAAIHAGWRGLLAGIIDATLQHFALPTTTLAWLGPVISQSQYRVGEAVRRQFLQKDANMKHAFCLQSPQYWQMDLLLIARQQLNNCGVSQIFGGHWCTYNEDRRFFSYRRDGQTGRMASLIWLT